MPVRRHQPTGCWPPRPLVTRSAPPGRHQPTGCWPPRPLVTGSGPPRGHQPAGCPSPRLFVTRSAPPALHPHPNLPPLPLPPVAAGAVGVVGNAQRSPRGCGRPRSGLPSSRWAAGGTRAAAFPRPSTGSFSPVPVYSPHGGSNAPARDRPSLSGRHQRLRCPAPRPFMT